MDTLNQHLGNSTDFGPHITILGAGKYAIEGRAHIANMDPAEANASCGPTRVFGFNRAS